MGVVIRELDDKGAERWDAYVNRAEGATFFHLAGWKRVIENAFGHRTYFLYAEADGEIAGVLPLGHVRSRVFGNSLISLPFCVYGGVVADSGEIRLALEEEAIALARRLNVNYLEMRNQEQVHAEWPCKDDLYVTFKKEILPDPEENMKAIPRKQRAMVRKGIEAGLIGEADSGVERFYEAYARSVHALGTPVFSKRYFELLNEVFGDACQVLTITKEGRLIASVMSFYFRDEVLPYYGGGTSEARQYKGNDFMYWELMRQSCERGIKVFDYGRSKVGTGSYSFKKNWGFEPKPLYYEYSLVKAQEIPNISPTNPKYDLFIKLWKKLPYPVATLIGPHIVKQLG